jgi:hypothetical protein
MHNFIDGVEKALIQKKEKEKAKIEKAFRASQISPRTYQKKNKEIEMWVDQEEVNLKKKKKLILQGWMQASDIITRLDDEMDNVKNKLGKRAEKINLLERSLDGISQPSDISLEEESNDSLRVREAKM